MAVVLACCVFLIKPPAFPTTFPLTPNNVSEHTRKTLTIFIDFSYSLHSTFSFKQSECLLKKLNNLKPLKWWLHSHKTAALAPSNP
jgi:hypothetical protein